MSDKIDISTVAEVIKQHKLEPSIVREIIEELNARAEAKEADKAEPTPRGKQQYVALISDPEGKIKQDLVGWVFQLPENASPATILDRVMKATHDFNASKKGRLLPVKSVGEAVESVSRKFFKNAEIAVKTKTPIYFLRTDNKLTEAPTA
jgi:hypothetical protein